VRPHEMLMPAAGAQQTLVYAESRAACTTLLRELAADLSGGRGPDPVALLVDPSPEELADWKREAPKAEIVSAGQERHAEDALAQAARRAESGEAVVLLIDSLTRVGEEFGGSKAAKELFDGGLASAGSGSLTVIAAVERPAE
jgi:transcription termination factor Rho